MAGKQSGIGMTLSCDNSAGVSKDIANDVTNVQFATPYALQDVTGLDKSAIERLQLLADFSATLGGVFNPDADKSHTAFSVLTGTRTLALGIGGKSLSNEVLLSDYNLTRANTGEFTFSVPASLQSGTVPTWA